MHAWPDLFTTGYGILNGIGLATVLGGLGYFVRYVLKPVEEDTERHDRLLREADKR
jgi:hypothetical protein